MVRKNLAVLIPKGTLDRAAKVKRRRVELRGHSCKSVLNHDREKTPCHEADRWPRRQPRKLKTAPLHRIYSKIDGRGAPVRLAFSTKEKASRSKQRRLRK
jgi:hypothetical protein